MNNAVVLVVCCLCFLPGISCAEQAQASVVPAVESKQAPRLITIPEGMRLVANDSRLLKIAMADKDMSFADTLMARSALLPHISASANESFLKFRPEAKSGTARLPTAGQQSFSYGFDVYQTLYDFGKSFSQYKAALQLEFAQKVNTDRVKKIAVLEFVVAYFDVLEAEAMIQVVQKEEERLQAYLHDVNLLYAQGAAIKNDLLPAQVKLADAAQKLIVARNLRQTLAAKLNTIMALPIHEKIQVQDIRMEIASVPELAEAWGIAQAQRPELAIIADQLKASSLSEKAKKADRYPALYAQGGYAFSQNKYQVHQDTMNINLGAKMDVFDGGLAQAEVFKERSRNRGLLAQQGKLAEDIKLEIEDSYLGFKDAQEKVAVSRNALAQAAENVRVTRVKYAQGEAISTEVLESIALETNAQTNHYSATYELKRNYAKLMYSMGIDLALMYDTIHAYADVIQKQKN